MNKKVLIPVIIIGLLLIGGVAYLSMSLQKEKQANKEMQELAEIIKYAEQYRENKSYNDRYKKSKDPDRFLRKYESHIILFSGAERMLQRKGIDPAHMNLNHLKSRYNEMLSKKKELVSHYKTTNTEIKELELIRQNMEKYLDITPPKTNKTLDSTTPEI